MIGRRLFLKGSLAVLVSACSSGAVPAPESPPLKPTPACGNDPTPPQTAGPYYTPDTPRRSSLLEPGLKGTRLVLAGWVMNRRCEPVANALLDFWQADDEGVYDNSGYRLRGHLFADADGRYQMETIVPGIYPGRTRHIHVRVQAPGGPVLTTQLYFPDEPGNARDAIFQKELVMAVQPQPDGKRASFDFVLNL